MATGSEILKELFVSLSWIHDEMARKKVVAAEHKTTAELEKESKARETFARKGRESLEATLKTFAKFTIGAEAMAIGVVAAVEKMASSFEKAYYSSSRTGASVKELNAFGYAASQMGSSAESATASAEALAVQLKTIHGYRNIIANLSKQTGVSINADTKDSVALVEALGEALSKLPGGRDSQQARAFKGLFPALGDEAFYNFITRPDERRKFEAQNRRKYSTLGFDPEKAAEDGKNLSRLFRTSTIRSKKSPKRSVQSSSLISKAPLPI